MARLARMGRYGDTRVAAVIALAGRYGPRDRAAAVAAGADEFAGARCVSPRSFR